MGEACMYIYLLVLLIDVIRKKSFSIFHIWLIAFIFIICSDMIQQPNYDTWSSIYNINASNILILGYFYAKERKGEKKRKNKTSEGTELCQHKSSSAELFIWGLFALYVYAFSRVAMNAFALGRIIDADQTIQDSQFLFSEIAGSIGLVLPAISAYYYRIFTNNQKHLALVISVPIFFLLFMMGTRYPLLFSTLGFLIGGRFINMMKLNAKSATKLLLSAVVILGLAEAMKDFRVGGFESISYKQEVSDNSSFSEKLTSKMSPEGIINGMNMEHHYFESNNHTYGLSTGFVLYFWIPRALWPDKPTMLGSWLVRKYSSVSGAFSASYGFAGEPYADFGYFSLLLLFFFGIGLKSIEIFQEDNFKRHSVQSIIAAIMYPYVFFFVRSPVTSTITLLGAFAFYYLFTKLIKQ